VPLISRRSLDTGRSSSSNLVGETHVPRNAPGTPQANASFWPARAHAAGTSESARERQAALASLEAPDFALPDPTGRMHRLSDYRGKKVFLVTWASW